MAKLVKVYVIDSKGVGLAGQKVQVYGEGPQLTDSHGCVSLMIEGSKTAVYVNGFSVFDGFTADLKQKEIFTKSGERP